MSQIEPRRTWCSRKARWFCRALSDRRGVSAIEFAFIAPVLIALYVGAVQLGNALTINRRVFSVASTTADLAAQVKSVSTGDLQDITSAASSILTPFSTAPLRIVVSSVVADNNNNTNGRLELCHQWGHAARQEFWGYATGRAHSGE